MWMRGRIAGSVKLIIQRTTIEYHENRGKKVANCVSIVQSQHLLGICCKYSSSFSTNWSKKQRSYSQPVWSNIWHNSPRIVHHISNCWKFGHKVWTGKHFQNRFGSNLRVNPGVRVPYLHQQHRHVPGWCLCSQDRGGCWRSCSLDFHVVFVTCNVNINLNIFYELNEMVFISDFRKTLDWCILLWMPHLVLDTP